MERNPILRPHCSPRNEEEVAKQRNRLQLAQRSLLAFNQKLIDEIAPTLGQTRDVEAAVSLARLQFHTDRLARINEKLETLANGTTLDGQHDDALDSVKEASRIIDSLQRRLHEPSERIPPNEFYPEIKESNNTDETKEPEEDAGFDSKETTFTTPMGIPLIDRRPQGSRALIKDSSAEMAIEILQAATHASPRTQDAVILETPHEKGKAGHEVSPQCTPLSSSPEENIPDDGSSSEGVTIEDHVPEVFERPPGCRYAAVRYRADSMQTEVHRRENARLDGDGLCADVEKTTLNGESSQSDSPDRVSGKCGNDWCVYRSRALSDTSSKPNEVLKEAPLPPEVVLLATTKTATVQLLQHEGSAPRTEQPKRAAPRSTDPTTVTVHLRVGLRPPGEGCTSQGKRSKKDAAASMIEPKHVADYSYGSSPNVVMMKKHRPKVRRKAKSRRKRRPKIRKKL